MAKILSYIFAVIMLLSAIGHLVAGDAYAPMIPDFIPVLVANIASTIAEGAIGIMLLLPKYRAKGGLVFALLMVAFLPIHVWDLFKEEPAIGSQIGAIIRIPIQFLLIYGGWFIYKKVE